MSQETKNEDYHPMQVQSQTIAFGLPFGLIMMLITGGEVFTDNTALIPAAVRLEHDDGSTYAYQPLLLASLYLLHRQSFL